MANARTRVYVVNGESEGKSLVDAMRDGSDDGMQYFDGEIEKLIRSGVVDLETGLAYATNPGNLRLALSDFDERNVDHGYAPPSNEEARAETEFEIER